MAGRIILVRHAETDGNKARYAGREDIPLNAEGVRQARDLAVALEAETFQAIFSSPLTRAIQTATPLAEQRGRSIAIREALVEIDFGALQGALKSEHELSLRKHHRERPMAGGESLRDVWNRLRPFGDELTAGLSDGGTLVVVGHYWSNRLLADMLSGRAFEDALAKDGYKPANASACALDFAKAGRDPGPARMTWLHRSGADTQAPVRATGRP